MEIIWLILGIGAGMAGMWEFLNIQNGSGTTGFTWPNAVGQTPSIGNTTTIGPPSPQGSDNTGYDPNAQNFTPGP